MKTLSHKLIITKVPYVSRYAADEQTKTLSVLMNHKECVEISCDIEEERSLIGNIYVGKVKNIVKNIRKTDTAAAGQQQGAYRHDHKRPGQYTVDSIHRKFLSGNVPITAHRSAPRPYSAHPCDLRHLRVRLAVRRC